MKTEIGVRLGCSDKGPLNGKEQGAGGQLSEQVMPMCIRTTQINVDPAMRMGEGLSSPLGLCP